MSRREVGGARVGTLRRLDEAPEWLLKEGREKYPMYPSTEMNQLHKRRQELAAELQAVEGQISEKCKHPQDAFGFQRYNDTDTLGNITRTHYVLVCRDCGKTLADRYRD